VSAASISVLIEAQDKASGVIANLSKSLSGLGGMAVGAATAGLVAVAAGGAAMVAGLGAAVGAAADFEKTMSGVGAVTGASQDEMAALSKKALQLGKDTAFGAAEAAAGLGELAKGGVSIEDILDGAATAMTNLAAAGGIKLPQAAEVAANAMSLFSLKGKDVENVANKIAGAANASTIDVNDFSLSMKAAGGVIKLTGGSFDDAALAITAMGKAGYKGSDAGTSLKTMYLNLIPKTKEQIALSKELGLITADGANAFFDASGKVKSYSEIAGVMAKAFGHMTAEQRTAKMETLFNTDAIRAAEVAMSLGAEGADKLAAAMSKVSAEAVGQERMKNLAGSWEMFTGSVETAGIVLGSAFIPALKLAVDGATGLLNNAMPGIEAFAKGISTLFADVGSAISGEAPVTEAAVNEVIDAINRPWLDEGQLAEIGKNYKDFIKQGFDPKAVADLFNYYDPIDEVEKIARDLGQGYSENVALGVTKAAPAVGSAVQRVAGVMAGGIAKALGFTPEQATAISNGASGVVKAVEQAKKDVDTAIAMAGMSKDLAESGGVSGGGAAAGSLAWSITKKLGFTPEASLAISTDVKNFVSQVEGALKNVDAIFSNRAGSEGQKGAELGLAQIIKDAFGPDAVNPAITGIQNLDLALENLDPTIRGMKSAFEEGGIQGAIAAAFGQDTLDAMTRFGEALNTHVVPGLGLLKDAFSGTKTDADGMKDSTNGVIEVLDLLSTAIESTGKAFEILGGLRDIAEIMRTDVTGFFGEIGTAAGTLGTDIGKLDGTTESFDRVKASAETLATVLMGHFTEIGKAAIELANENFPQLSKGGDTLHTNLAYTFMQIGIKAGTMKTEVSNALNGIVTVAQGIADSIFNVGFNIGFNAVQGVINGIGSLLGAARAKAAEIGEVVKGALAERLKLGSPSRVTYQYGQWFVEGFTDGITAAAFGGAGAAASMGQSFMEAFQQSITSDEISWRDVVQHWFGADFLSAVDAVTDRGMDIEKAVAAVHELFSVDLIDEAYRLPAMIRNLGIDIIDEVHELPVGIQEAVTRGLSDIKGSDFTSALETALTSDDIRWQDVIIQWFGYEFLDEVEKASYAGGLSVTDAVRQAMEDGTSSIVAAARDLARDTAGAFQGGWAESMRQFNPQTSFDFLDQRDFDHWQELRKTLPDMQNLLLAPTGPSIDVPQPSDQKIRDDMMMGLNASHRTPTDDLLIEQNGLLRETNRLLQALPGGMARGVRLEAAASG